MVILYKKIGKKILYWSAMEISRRKGYISQAVVGEPEGQPEEITTGFFSSFNKEVAQRVEVLKLQGYVEEINDYTLVIDYPYSLSISQREQLETGIEDVLDPLNLGFTDSSFSKSSVHCNVLDADLAQKLITKYLSTTPFSDYKEVYVLEHVSDDDDGVEEEDEDDE